MDFSDSRIKIRIKKYFTEQLYTGSVGSFWYKINRTLPLGYAWTGTSCLIWMCRTVLGFQLSMNPNQKHFPPLNTDWVLPLSPLSLGSKMQDRKSNVFMVVCLSEWFDHEPCCCFCHSDPANPPLTEGEIYSSGTCTLWLYNTSFFLIPCHDVD